MCQDTWPLLWIIRHGRSETTGRADLCACPDLLGRHLSSGFSDRLVRIHGPHRSRGNHRAHLIESIKCRNVSQMGNHNGIHDHAGDRSAVVLPIYYILIVWKSSSSARASFMPSGSARALLPAVLFGFLIPSIFLLAPEFFQNQAFLEWGIAVWQLFPILVSFVATTLGFCFSGSDSRSITTTEAVISTTFIVSSLDTTILISFVLHLYAIYSIYNQGLTISTFLPNSDFGTAEDAFYAFFAIDLLGCLISTWTLIFYDTSRYAGVGKTSVLSAALIAVFGTLLFGPGGAAAVRTFPQKIKFERIKIDEI